MAMEGEPIIRVCKKLAKVSIYGCWKRVLNDVSEKFAVYIYFSISDHLTKWGFLFHFDYNGARTE